MKHIHIVSFSLLALLSISLTSCSGIFSWMDENLFGKGDHGEESSQIIIKDETNVGQNNNIIRDKEMFGVSLSVPNTSLTPLQSASKERLDEVYADGIDIRSKYNQNFTNKTPTRGNPHVLVVPILFKGTGLDPDVWQENDVRRWLTQAFFGASETMEWESLSSYYNKASFGALNITGEVAPIYNSSYTYKQMKDNPEEVGYGFVDNILADIYDTYFKSNIYDINDFDDDKDGIIDGVYAIYLNFHDVDSCLWAYQTSLDYRHRSQDRMAIDNYVWMSFDFFENLANPNSQTVIHESGHMLGLDDYYNAYDQELNLPTGGVDMMDYNVGYQESFSSYALGWTVPYVVDDKSLDHNEFTLRPFESSGDSIILASDFNGTSFDEYLIMEYYTTGGLNSHFVSKSNVKTQEINQNGLLIYHVDQRLGLMKFSPQRGWYWSGQFVDRITDSQDSFSLVVASNARSLDGKQGSSYSGFNLVSLLDGNAINGYNKFEHKQAIANASTLFTTNDKFLDHYPNFTFNDKSKLNFDITVGKMDNNGIKISIDRI